MVVAALRQRRIRHPIARRKTAWQNRAVFIFAEDRIDDISSTSATSVAEASPSCCRQPSMPQQRHHERQREQRGHTLPKANRVTLKKRLRPSNFRRRARRSGLNLHGKFGRVAKTLGGTLFH